MDNPVDFPRLPEMEEPDWLAVAAEAPGPAENQHPAGSGNAVPSPLPPTTTSTATTHPPPKPPKPAPTAVGLIQDKPWKYVGYQAYSDLLASEPDFFIARKTSSPRELSSWTRSRHHYIVTTTLLKYPAAPAWDIASLKNWHMSHDNEAILREEQTYLEYPDDLIPLGPRDKTPLRRAMDRFLFLRTLPFWRDDRSKTLSSSGRRRIGDLEDGSSKDGAATTATTDDLPLDALFPTMRFYSDKVMDRTVSVVTISIGLVMLVVPIWVLQALGKASLKLGVITAFVLACLLLTSFAMTSRPLDALGATAAYAAVLMVFLQVGASN
ncbi:hypothetical protein C8A00DRAFT_15577 [Chaetomidium leptoderma]|uniref:DUF6594 domain-containing protein n=1 Tax=Chaetomidium leptoderma TaxID=669021 RepID=A0AAN6ZV76_9PEZI|nr:hypothetical protein C8A00DRAFT_15577 [Chaetomidium leptoderma]